MIKMGAAALTFRGVVPMSISKESGKIVILVRHSTTLHHVWFSTPVQFTFKMAEERKITVDRSLEEYSLNSKQNCRQEVETKERRTTLLHTPKGQM